MADAVPLKTFNSRDNKDEYDNENDHSHSITLNNLSYTHDEKKGVSGNGSNSNTKIESDSSSDSATNSEDEFDWSAEEDDDPDAEGGKGKDHPKSRRGRKIYLAFLKLARPVRTIIIALLGSAILIAPLLVVQFRFHSSPVYRHVFAWSLWLAITWMAGCITSLIVELVPRVVIAVTGLFGGQVENLKTQLELMLAVSAWLKLALSIAWAWLSLSVIRSSFHPPGSYWVIINRVMQALFTAGIILFVEKLFLRFVAIRFHQKALADRLSQNRLALKALDRLGNAQAVRSGGGVLGGGMLGGGKARKAGGHGHTTNPSRGASLDLLNNNTNPGSSSGSSTNEKTQTHRKTHSKSTPPSTTRRKRRGVRATVLIDQVSGAISQLALKDSRFNKQTEIGGLHSARRLAKELFRNLREDDVGGEVAQGVMGTKKREVLVVEDFYPYFRSTADATAAFAIFDKDNNGDITKKEMREAVQRIYRERKALTASLKDVGSAVAKLDAVLLFLALLLLIFVCLLIFNRTDTLSSLVPLASIVLGFSFIFGHSAQTLFESLIFIFSTHVFDVGDLVVVDDMPLFVKEFGLFSTVFRRVDGMEIVAPNSLLANSKLVHNLRRSNSMWETTTLTISYNTPLGVIEQLKTRLQAYVNDNNREWSGVAVNIDKMEHQNAIMLIVAMEHRSNWQDWGGRWARRTQFMRNMKTVLEELDVRYTLPVQPVVLPRNFNPYLFNSHSHTNLGGPGLGRSSTVSGVPRGPGGFGASTESLSLRESFGNAGFMDRSSNGEMGMMGRAPPVGSAASLGAGGGVRIRVSGGGSGNGVEGI